MRPRHTQGPAVIAAVSSKTLVNRARMKVVNIALTKNFRHSGMRALARRPGIHNHRAGNSGAERDIGAYGFRVRAKPRAPE
jgi:hypothetical protein